jgi:predicted transcriptional regulator
MPTVTVNLSEEQAQRLENLAEKLKVRPNTLLQASVADLLGRGDDEFHSIVEYVLEKNAELYRRLA